MATPSTNSKGSEGESCSRKNVYRVNLHQRTLKKVTAKCIPRCLDGFIQNIF